MSERLHNPGDHDAILAQMAAVPSHITRQLSPRVRALMGYSIHPPFMGMCDGMHPKRKLPMA